MHVLVYDPYVPGDHIRTLGAEPSALDPLLERAQYISLHVPLTDTTRGIINAERLAQMQPTACLVNCARGELIEQDALLAALDAGQLAAAAIDVYPNEPVGPVDLARQLGKLATQLVDAPIRSTEIEYRGAITEENTSAVTATAIQGLLEPISDVPVNLVNARLLARQRGLEVVERRSPTPDRYTSLVRVTVRAGDHDISVAGVVSDGRPSIVQIGDYELHLPATPGYLLLTSHQDRPGIIGIVGQLLGAADVNISSMQVRRATARGRALMLLSVDDPIPPAVVSQLRGLDNFAAVKVLRL